MTIIPKKHLMLEFLAENSNKKIDKIKNIIIQDYDSEEDGFIGENYIVTCVLRLPDPNIPIYNLNRKKKVKCLINVLVFHTWLSKKNAVRFIN
jgi:hypothetical protein